MKVGVFVPQHNDEHAAVLTAFHEGLELAGVDTFMSSLDRYIDCDVAVVFGHIKDTVFAAKGRSDLIRYHQSALRRRVLVIEKGYVRRDAYYAVGWDHFNGRADFMNAGSPPDRWQQLDVRLMPWRGRERHPNILVVGQVPHDASVQHIVFIDWASQIVHHCNRLFDKKIVWRPHPLARSMTPDILGAETSRQSLEEDLAEAETVITFNSNTAVDSVIAGVPTLTYDIGSMAWTVTRHTLPEATHRAEPENREQWAHNLAYTQWTLGEMRNGLPWKHLTRETS